MRIRIKLVKEIELKKEEGESWIGLISDTHIPTRAREIPRKVFNVFSKADIIIHAGDLVRTNVLKELEKVAPVVAVHGNMDFSEVKEKLPRMNSVEIAGKKIGVIHNVGIFRTEIMEKIAKENYFDILVFGHTHRQFFMEKEGRIFVNPGSATNPMPPLLVKPSVALLKISKEKVEPIFIEI